MFLPANASREVAWKNGGGFTREIAVEPRGASYEDFDWRVSLARIERDGPFSLLAAVERLFVVVQGTGLLLEVEGAVVALDEHSPPLSLAGEAPAYARLSGGPVQALNVMTRKGRARASLSRLDVAEPMALRPDIKTWLLVVLAGAADVDARRVGPGDAWRGGGASAQVSPDLHFRGALVMFDR